MDISKIAAQPKENEFNVIIEIPMNSDPIKYEFDKESGAILVDRFIGTPMFYPANYGFIPHTLSGDGDPVDVLVVSNYPVIPGAIIRVRVVGVLLMQDEAGADEKIIAVPVSKLDKSFDHVNEISDLNQSLCNKIIHFFEHYKDLEKGKWVNVDGFDTASKAIELINQAINNNQ